MAGRAFFDLRYVLSVAVLAIAYVASAEVGFSMAFATKQVTAIWPPTGIALAALLLRGNAIWPGIWLGAFISNAISSEPLITAAMIAGGNTVATLASAFLLRGFAKFDVALERIRDVVALVVLGSIGAMTISATNGVISLALAHLVVWPNFWPVWRLWWIGDALGAMLVTPFLTVWALPRAKHAGHARFLELAALSAALAAVTWFSFVSGPLSYPSYPLIVWIALRFRQRETATALVFVSAVAIWGTVHGHGPFTIGTFDYRLMRLDIYIAVMTITGLVVCATSEQRRQADLRLAAAHDELRARERELELAERRFQVLAESLPQIAWTADATGWIDWYNRRWYEYTGQTPEESEGWGWQRAHHPEDFPRVMDEWQRSIATGKRFDAEFRIRRGDGEFRWYLARAEPMHDESGKITRWYGTNTDIHDQKRMLEQTTHIAQTLQAAFLPERLPERRDLHFDALYLSAGQDALIGGDWYDGFELADGRVVISIGDVVGHGLDAALTAGRLRHGIFATALDAQDPALILTKVDHMLHFEEGRIATALVAIIAADLTEMTYATAGHPTPVIACGPAPARALPYGGTPLGAAMGPRETHRVRLEHGCVIAFYTDGITEFERDIEGAETRLFRAVETLAREGWRPNPARFLQRAVMRTTQPTDDVALLVVHVNRVTMETSANDSDLRKIWRFHSSDAYSAQSARHELMRFVRAHAAIDADLFDTELILGELLANTVEHAPGLVEMEIDWTEDYPVIHMTDTGPGLSSLAIPVAKDQFAEGGRGLFLISTLARDVRIEPALGSGTTMRIVLPVARVYVSATAGTVQRQ